jgi:hypothetical protein
MLVLPAGCKPNSGYRMRRERVLEWALPYLNPPLSQPHRVGMGWRVDRADCVAADRPNLGG